MGKLFGKICRFLVVSFEHMGERRSQFSLKQRRSSRRSFETIMRPARNSSGWWILLREQ